MALSLFRRTKDALLYPSLYFERVREESARPALAYYIVTEAILFFISYLPYAYLSSATTPEFLLSMLWFAPAAVAGLLIATLLTHLAVFIVNKGKAMEDTLKFVIYNAQPMRLLGVVCAFITVTIAYLLFKSYVPEQFDIASLLFTIQGFIKTFAVVLILFIAAYVLFAVYAMFRMLVGMHKLFNMSLERSFWTNVLSALFNVLFAVGVLIIANNIF